MCLLSFNVLEAKLTQDTRNFPPPWEYPTTFATPVLHLPIVKREDNLMRLYDAGPINATIVGISD